MSSYFQGFLKSKISLIQDFKQMGVWETLKKVYQLREAWWEKGNKILVGSDKYGNKYWETTEPTELNRGRWVEFAGKKDKIYDASDIPAEWHMWIHRLRDEPPTPEESARKGFGVRPEHERNWTGNPQKRHYPPGHFFNPEHRDVSTIEYEEGRAPEQVFEKQFAKMKEEKLKQTSTL